MSAPRTEQKPAFFSWRGPSRRLWLLIALGIALRFAYVGRLFDDRLVNSWHQSDYIQIARNFHREGMNILYPRVDWRGDTPGFAEMEFPLLPWMGALLYQVFGEHAQVMRVLAASFETGAFILFALLAPQILPANGALFATAAFALNPLLVVFASSMQPEPVMQFFSLLAVTFLWRWSRSGAFSSFLAAALATGLAIMAKLPAAHLGLLLAYFVLRRHGGRAFLEPQVYLAVLVAVLPPAVWYAWSHRFYELYGLSLGVTNESHLIGWDMLFPPRFLAGILRTETLFVFTPLGWALALGALWLPRQTAEPLVTWYLSVMAFYVVTGRTSGDTWASYYHVISAAPACLLMGAGATALATGEIIPDRFHRLAGRSLLLAGGVGACVLLALALVTGLKIYRRDHNVGEEELPAMRACAAQFAPHVPASERIVVRGGTMHDEYGHPVAYNEPMMFAYMDRKGFNYGNEELSIDTLEAIAASGGRYWMVAREELVKYKLEQSANAQYHRIATCDDAYYLYDLRGR